VRGADFLPGEKMLISGSHDKELKLWNLEGYEEFRALKSQLLAGEKGHKDALLSAAFSSDGKQIVTSSRDRSAKVWNAADGKHLQTLSEGHEYLVNAVALFPDGQRFATAAMDNTTRIWDLNTGTELKQLPQTGQNAIVAISRNGQWLATAGNGQFAQVWNAANGELVKQLAGHRAEVTAAAFSHDDQFLATADNGGRLRLWRTETFELVWTHDRHTEAVTDLAFSHDGKWLFSSSGDNTVGCARVRDGIEEPKRNWKHGHAVSSMAVAANDSVGATLNALGQVQIWDPATGKSVRTCSGVVGRPSHVALTADGRKLLVVTSLLQQNAHNANENAPAEQKRIDPMQDENREQSMIIFFDTATGKELEKERIAGSLMWSAAFMPDGDRAISVGGNGAKLWEVGKSESLMTFTPHGAVASARFSPNGKMVLTGSWDTLTKAWSLEKGRAARVMPHVHQGPINSSVYSDDGKQLLTASDDGTAVVWSVEMMQPTKTLRGHKNHVRAGMFLPKSNFSVTVGNDGTARVWNNETGTQLAISPTHTAPITSVDVILAPQAMGNESKRKFLIVTGCEDNSSRLWTWDGASKEIQPANDANRKPIVLAGHTAAITSVAFSPNGSRVLTGSSDACVKLWDAHTGKEILTLNGHSQEVTSACFSPDGSQVLSASRDGTAIIWLADGWKKN
jgi:WD40 repeat protein